MGSGNVILGGSPEGAILGDGDAPSALQPFVKFFEHFQCVFNRKKSAHCVRIISETVQKVSCLLSHYPVSAVL